MLGSLYGSIEIKGGNQSKRNGNGNGNGNGRAATPHSQSKPASTDDRTYVR